MHVNSEEPHKNCYLRKLIFTQATRDKQTFSDPLIESQFVNIQNNFLSVI